MTKDTVEDYHSLDANKLKKAGVLQAGYHGNWQWSRNGKRVSDIALYTDNPKSVRFIYQSGKSGKRYNYPVTVEWLPCHLGGYRVMFHCPICNKRCTKLMMLEVFQCRKCANLNYRSQQASKRDRALDQSYKLRAKLGWYEGMLDCPARDIPKPKWMRWKTHEKIISRMEKYEAEDMVMLCKWLNIHTS